MNNRNDTLMILSRVIFTLPASIFFVVLMPIIIVRLSPKITFLNHYRFGFGHLNCLLGWIMILIGLALSLWTIYTQIRRGSGTPIPILPPAKLLMNGPYEYCRNPMAFGGYLYYSGICFCLGSLSAFFIVILFIAILTAYIKKRFGQAYLEYQKQTPFMIPKIFGKRWYFLFLH